MIFNNYFYKVTFFIIIMFKSHFYKFGEIEYSENIQNTEAVVIDLNQTYEVEKILTHKVDSNSKITHFFIKWVGFPICQSTWEPYENMKIDIPYMVSEYERSLTSHFTPATNRPKPSSKYKGKKYHKLPMSHHLRPVEDKVKTALNSRVRAKLRKPPGIALRKGRIDRKDIPESIRIIHYL